MKSPLVSIYNIRRESTLAMSRENIDFWADGELGPGVSTPSKLEQLTREAGSGWGSALLVRL